MTVTTSASTRYSSRLPAPWRTSRLSFAEAHKRNLRVITELVHQPHVGPASVVSAGAACPAGSPERDFYVWTDERPEIPGRPGDLPGLRALQLDLGPGGRCLLLAPVLFASARPQLRQSGRCGRRSFRVVDFWLAMGVDGLRLDAVPYLYEREGTNCENLPRPHQFLKRLRSHVDAHYPGRMLLAEANQWPEDAVLFRRGRRMPHGVSLPAHAAPVHGACTRKTDFRSHDIMAQTPTIPADLPVVPSSCAITTS